MEVNRIVIIHTIRQANKQNKKKKSSNIDDNSIPILNRNRNNTCFNTPNLTPCMRFTMIIDSQNTARKAKQRNKKRITKSLHSLAPRYLAGDDMFRLVGSPCSC